MGQGLAPEGDRPAQAKPGPRRRQVTIVAGPPCSGKNWFVDHHKGPDDHVVDLDAIAVKLGSPVQHGHTGSMYGNSEKIFQQMLRRARAAQAGTFWVIRCGAEPEVRRDLINLTRATRCIVLLPNIVVAKQRAMRRDVVPAGTIQAIDSWFKRFHPAPFDEVLRS